MFSARVAPGVDRWEPPLGGAIAEPNVPALIVMFGLRACWYESFPFDAQLPRIEPGRIVLPCDEPGVAGAAGDVGVELPVRYRGLTLGRFVLVPASPTCGVAFSAASRAEGLALADSVGQRIATAIIMGRVPSS
jgi:hypothetical protein